VTSFGDTVRETYALTGRKRRWRWVLLLVLALLRTGLEAVGALLIYTLLQLVSDPAAGAQLPLVGQIEDVLPDVEPNLLAVGAAVTVGVFFLVRAVFLVVHSYVEARIAHNVGADLATRLVRGYVSLPYLFHTQRNSATLVRNTFDSVQQFVNYVLGPLLTLVADTLLVVGLLVVLLSLSPLATLIAIAVLGTLMWILLHLVQPRLKALGRQAQDARGESLKALQQSLGGIRDIRLLGKETHFVRRFSDQRRALARAEYINGAISEVPRAMIEAGLVLFIVVVFGVAVTAGAGVTDLLSTLGLFAYAAWRMLPSLRFIVSALNSLKFSTAILEDLSVDLARGEAAMEARGTLERAGPTDARGFSSTIEVRDLWFRYDEAAEPALREIDLTIRKGESIGICGPTGGGKSTLVDLLVGLLQPTSGAVLVDGRPLDAYPGWWFRQLGVVSQEVFLLDDTLRKNIAFGLPDDEIDEELLERSVRRAQLDDVVATLPAGLDTVVGERGARLSGGQRQRVSIARALYREPSVIVLDEGTSALDSATEAAFVAALAELKQGRTLITVAHRLSTVRRADRIVVVEGGRIAAEGTYEDLLERSELFRALAR
jgi:ATP-binding cassette, subfamily B, bacterial PglK